MVTEDYVSFEIAKLLKDRGFDINAINSWHIVPSETCNFEDLEKVVRGDIDEPEYSEDYYPMITLQMAMKWLEEKCFPYALDDNNPARDCIVWLKSLRSQPHWNPTEEDVALFNRAVTTNTTLTSQERAKLDIIRMKFKHRPYIEQKEQKPIESECPQFVFDDVLALDYAMDIVYRKGNEQKLYEALKSLHSRLIDALDNKQQPAEWSEDYDEDNLQARFAFYTYRDDPSTLYLSNVFVEETSRNKGFGTKILAAAERVAETLGITSIRLKVKRDSPANAWYRKHGYSYMTFKGDYDWLEKKYMKPNMQEWSEEDKEMLDAMIDIVSNSLYEPLCPREGMLAWLKSLRPQPAWKPSEEQK